MEDEIETISPRSGVTTPPRSANNNIHIKVLQRDKLIRRLTSVRENLDQFSRLSPYQLETKLSPLDHHFQLFGKLQAELESLDESQIEQDHRLAFEDSFCEVKSAIVQRIAESRRVDALNSTTLPAIHSTPATRHSLLKLQLTKFCGNHTEWLDFYNMFSTLVHNKSALDGIEKFQYLRSCLTNNGFRLIQSLEVTNDNYNRAVDLLVRRYDNKRYILQSHLQAIFDSKGLKTSSASSLREFIDSVNSNLRALQSLATKPQIADGILLHFIATKLDPEMQVKWEEYVASKWDNPSSSPFQLPSWDDLATFIERRCQTVNIIEASRKAVDKSRTAAKSSAPVKSGTSFVTSASSKGLLCNEASSHSAFKCAKFTAMDPVQRSNLAKKNHVCLNCLWVSHTSIKCPSTKRCQTCCVSHHTLLHRHPEANIQRRSDTGLPAEPPSSSTTLQVSLNKSQVLLGTALIQISTSRGTVMQARALLDSASQLNFITENVAQHLRLKRTPVNLEVAGIGRNATKVRHTAAVVIKSLTNAYAASMNTIIISTITSNQPQQFIDTSAWPILTNILLADTGFHTPGPIDVLIGASLFFDLMLLGQIKIKDVALQKMQLGWIFSGECKGASPSQAPTPYKSFVTTSDEPAVDRTLERFWIIEEPPSQSSPLLSQEERACEQFYEKTVRRCPSTCKFIVRLPLKLDPSSIGQSLNIASRRLSSLQSRLRSNPGLQQQYSAFINEYIELQHMQLCSADYTLTHAVNYIPHHCVAKEDSSTTKLRVVFDASCRTSNGISLNDLLMVGPTLQNDLITILMRFRRHAYVIMADIANMYRQVWVDERDTKYQCVLWNDNPRKSASTYQLKTITYGTSCAPYLVIKCLRTLAEQHKSDLPLGSAVTLRDFYVDNLISGGSTITEIIQQRDQVTTLLNHGGFPLRKFASNSPTIREDISP